MFWGWAAGGSAAPVHEFIFWDGTPSHVCVIKDVLGILWGIALSWKAPGGIKHTTGEALLLPIGDFYVQSISHSVRLRGGGNSRYPHMLSLSVSALPQEPGRAEISAQGSSQSAGPAPCHLWQWPCTPFLHTSSSASFPCQDPWQNLPKWHHRVGSFLAGKNSPCMQRTVSHSIIKMSWEVPWSTSCADTVWYVGNEDSFTLSSIEWSRSFAVAPSPPKSFGGKAPQQLKYWGLLIKELRLWGH